MSTNLKSKKHRRWSENLTAEPPKATPVTQDLVTTAVFRHGINLLGKVCISSKSVAISAVQIGEPLFIVVTKGSSVRYGLAQATMLNPKIIYMSDETYYAVQSLPHDPGTTAAITRPYCIGIKYMDQKWNEKITYLFEQQAADVLLAIEVSLGIPLSAPRPHPSEVAARLKEVIRPEDFQGWAVHGPKTWKQRFPKHRTETPNGQS